jgi:hypothetical protein
VFRSRQGALAAAVVLVALLTVASSAAATVRYASPSGATTGQCTSTDPLSANRPCDIERAVQTVAQDTDEVIVNSGTYDLLGHSLDIGKAIYVHGRDGQLRPVIFSTSSSAGVTVTDPGARLRRVTLDYSGAVQGININVPATVEQIVVHSNSPYACLLEYDAILRDSVCFNDGIGGIAVEAQSLTAVSSADLRNVTAVATGTGSYGIEVRTSNAGDQQDVIAKNVIADGVSADVRAVAGVTGSISTITLSTSNYAIISEDPGSGITSVTEPGTGIGNQIVAPLFTDAGAGLFHQAIGSPTINAGTAVDLMGARDVDGNLRTQGAAPDIGADEYPQVSLTPPPPTTPVTTPLATPTFDLTAAIKRCKKKFRKGTKKRKRCIKKARARAQA